MNEKITPEGERRVRREQEPDQLRWIARARSLAAALDLVRQPILLLVPGEPLRVWHANAAARHRLSSHPELRLREGTVSASPASGQALAEAIAHVRTLGPGHPWQLSLPSRSQPIAATVQLLEFGAAADLPISDVLMLELHEPASVEQGLGRLSREFQLTRKEAEAALGLYSMGSIEALARCNGKSVHTVRTQLKAAMQKTGTHTQAGLVALVANRLTA